MTDRPKCPCTAECRERSARCRISCERYAVYEAERGKYYEEKTKSIERRQSAGMMTAAHAAKMRDNARKKREGRL